MTYGYRLNVEDVFFRMADREYERALAGMDELANGLDRGGSPRLFVGPASDESAASCVLAVVGWAVGLEAFVNQVWNLSVAPRIPTVSLRKKLLRTLSTPEKIEAFLQLSGCGDSRPDWISGVAQLIELRNKFVHYKQDVSYTGFEFAPRTIFDLRREKLDKLREMTGLAVEYLAAACAGAQLRTEFVDGQFELAFSES